MFLSEKLILLRFTINEITADHPLGVIDWMEVIFLRAGILFGGA